MEFRLLGPVEAFANGQVVDLGRPQQRLVLAVLLVDVGRLVPTELVIDRVWDVAPGGARRTLQVHVARLRRVLARADASVRLVGRAGGYLLDVDPDRVDAHRFQRLIGVASGHPSAAAALLGEALGLWRGMPLSDLPGQWAARVREGWSQRYLEAVVAWALAALQDGDPGPVVARLGVLVGEHPLVEPLAGAYMRALYAAGRPADALSHYSVVRRVLAEELGADPSGELQRLHRQILSGDPALAAVDRPETRVVPRQLPAPPQMFTGRLPELTALHEVHDASTVVISAIDGMAGIGKTALAVHAAHGMVDRYPDGQLFLDLRGHTPGMAPVEPCEALDHLLRALGVPGTEIPPGTQERAALYRTRLADRRVLVVLDNAAGEDQVLPLLPGSPGCLVLVTSRRRLAGLDHTLMVSLETLPVVDAVALFTQSVGEGRLRDGSAELLGELVELCDRLPLALRIAAARLRSHPAWGLSDLVRRLRDQQHRLVELEAGQRSVTAALDLSYRNLSADQQRAYRMVGLHPGPDLDAYATAALVDSTVVHASRMLDQLLDAHLLVESVAGRYRCHDLIRAHAADAARRDEAAAAGRAALERLLAYYRRAASLASDAAYPYERQQRPPLAPANTPVPDFPDAPRALAWLDAELANLLATAHDGPEHLLHLSAILHWHLRTRGRHRDAEILHDRAVATAQATGDPASERDALNGLGHIYRLQGRHEEAFDRFARALRIARAAGHRPGELEALNGLGHVRWMQGLNAQAADHYQEALQIARDIGHRHGELDTLNGLGHVRRLQGLDAQAADHYQQALQIARGIDHRHGELIALNGLGHIHRLRGRYVAAAEIYQHMLRIARATGHRVGELHALSNLGNVHRLQGHHTDAADHYQQLLDLARRGGDGNLEFEALQGLGRLRQAAGDPEAAIAHHGQALALADRLGQPLDQARAHDGLARAHHARNQDEHARKHWHRALDLLTDLGVEHTYDEETTAPAIRARLADLDEEQGIGYGR
ncbi:tetratricopeptide repeat protein [Actinomycetes bacterium KLBMP 9797]